MGYRKRFINLLQAVARHFDEKWVLLYVERWLKAPMEQADGSRQARDKATPQGGGDESTFVELVSALCAGCMAGEASCKPEV